MTAPVVARSGVRRRVVRPVPTGAPVPEGLREGAGGRKSGTLPRLSPWPRQDPCNRRYPGAGGAKPVPSYGGAVLRIERRIYDAIVAHARRDHPDEACGIVAGPTGSGRPERVVAMENAERSPTFYRFEPMEQLRVWREMERRDEEPVVIYHSHTATEAYPSRTDVALASEPSAHYVLVSTADLAGVAFRSFRIIDGAVEEEPVEIV